MCETLRYKISLTLTIDFHLKYFFLDTSHTCAKLCHTGHNLIVQSTLAGLQEDPPTPSGRGPTAGSPDTVPDALRRRLIRAQAARIKGTKYWKSLRRLRGDGDEGNEGTLFQCRVNGGEGVNGEEGVTDSADGLSRFLKRHRQLPFTCRCGLFHAACRALPALAENPDPASTVTRSHAVRVIQRFIQEAVSARKAAVSAASRLKACRVVSVDYYNSVSSLVVNPTIFPFITSIPLFYSLYYSQSICSSPSFLLPLFL